MASWQRAFIFHRALSHLLLTNEATHRGFIERYKQALFPALGTFVGQTVWKTYGNITRVTIWGRDHFRNNVRLAMVAEALGLGPRLYVVMRTMNRGFSERLFLLAQFLPHQKMCLYPSFGILLRGPFNGSLHASEVGVAISRRLIPVEERPNMCPACESCFCDHVMEGLVDL